MTLTERYQCSVCLKILSTVKSLEQHSHIHTGDKPHQCNICSQVFRFKSNLFEHMSVHTGATPYLCPYCKKACRLKTNLKKHLRTHVTTKEELEAAWKPFATQRHSPTKVEQSVSGTVTVRLPRMKGTTLRIGKASDWIEKIKNGAILPKLDINYALHLAEEFILQNKDANTYKNLFDAAKTICLEPYTCPKCYLPFVSKEDCEIHIQEDHIGDDDSDNAEDKNLFCGKCYKKFEDEKSLNLHENHHQRVNKMLKDGSLPSLNIVPKIQEPSEEEIMKILADPPLHEVMMEQSGGFHC